MCAFMLQDNICNAHDQKIIENDCTILFLYVLVLLTEIAKKKRFMTSHNIFQNLT